MAGGKESQELKLWTSSKDSTIQEVLVPECQRLQIPFSIIKYKGGAVPYKKGKKHTILAHGNKCLTALATKEVVPKNRKIETLRGFPYFIGDTSYFVSFDPFAIYTFPENKTKITIDLITAYRYARTGTITPKIGKYVEVSNYERLVKKVEALYHQTGERVPVSIDLETVGSDYMNPEAWILCISVTVKVGLSHVVFFDQHERPGKELKEQIKYLMKSPHIKRVGANFKYDILWMAKKWGIYCADVAYDVVIAGSLLDENRSNSLNTLSKVHSDIGGYDDEFNKKYDKSQMDKVPKQDLLTYAGADTDACLRVYQSTRPELIKHRGLANFYKQVMAPAIMTFSKMEYRGCVVDTKEYENLRAEVQEDIKKAEKQIFELFPSKMKKKWKDTFSLNKAEMKIEFMFTPNGLNLEPVMFTDKTKAPSTAMEHIEMFEDHPVAGDFVERLRDYSSATKTLTAYIDGFLKHLRSDGRYHPSYFLFHGRDFDTGKEGGTDTGRTSAKSPAIQTLPKHTKWAKKLRKVFIAPPGYVILSGDYSQAELRIMAVLSQCKRMLAAYMKGVDVHMVTAANVMGLTLAQFKKLPEEIQQKRRQAGKATNFGLIYRISAEGLCEYAKKAYKVDMTLEEAHQNRNTFLFETYPEISEFQDMQAARAKKHGFVRSPLGRIHRLPLVNSPEADVAYKQGTKATNSPIQSTASDLTVMAMNELDRIYGMSLFLMIHDNAAAYVKEDNLDRDAGRMKEVMENLPLYEKFGWSVPIQFEADIVWGHNLADMHKLE